MAHNEIVVHPTAPMPHGYTFVRKGNVYITAHCRRATHAVGRTVYVVSNDGGATGLGLRCPIAVAAAVRESERTSRSSRQEATVKRDAAVSSEFHDALLAAYPEAPKEIVPQIVQHATTKRQGRVARTGTLGLDARVRLAVRAHIRHRWTDYESLLRGRTQKRMPTNGRGKHKTKETKNATAAERGVSREEARALTLQKVDEVERQWAGKPIGKSMEKANADDMKKTQIKYAETAVQQRQKKQQQKQKQASGKSGRGDGSSSAPRRTEIDSKKGSRDGHRVQKQPATRLSTRLCKTEAAARIALYHKHQQDQATAKTREVIVIDDSDGECDADADADFDEDGNVTGDGSGIESDFDSDWTL